MTCKKKKHTHKYMTYEVYKMYEGGHILKRVVYDLLRIEYNISRKKDFEKKRWNLANKDCSKWEGKNCNCNYSFLLI